MTLRKLVILTACLAGLSQGALAADAGLQASAWTDYAKPKPIPVLGDPGCFAAGGAGCAEAWRKALAVFGQEPLDTGPGGRVYRALRGGGTANPYAVRLDIAADGRATVTTIFPGQPGQGASFSNAKVEAFDAALAASQFDKAPVSSTLVVCNDGPGRTVLEALVDDRYKYVVDACGTDAGLARALGVMQGG